MAKLGRGGKAVGGDTLDELMVNLDGLIQLAGWQLTMAREVRAKATRLAERSPAPPPAQKPAAAAPAEVPGGIPLQRRRRGP